MIKNKGDTEGDRVELGRFYLAINRAHGAWKPGGGMTGQGRNSAWYCQGLSVGGPENVAWAGVGGIIPPIPA